MTRYATTRGYRTLEMMPGFLVWLTFGLGIGLSFVAPLVVIYFIIIFTLYWFFRFFYLQTHLLMSFRQYRQDSKIAWDDELQRRYPEQRMYHAVFLPSNSASWEVVGPTLEAIYRGSYPPDRLLIILALEERQREINAEVAEKSLAMYGDKFGAFLISWHPDGLVGEVQGKGANLHHAGHVFKKCVDERVISYDQIIVSSFDIDTTVHKHYFSYLTCKYLEEKNPTRFSYQPVPLFNNNVWDAPALTRIAAGSTSFWLMTEQTRPESMFTFSSHSMSFQALVDVNFWQKDIVTEDSRIFLQCFMHYDGEYQVKPLYLPVSMDAVQSDTVWRSMVNIYKQQRRWAWGIEHFPYMMRHFRVNKKISLIKKIRYTSKLTEGMYSWATAPVLMLVLGRLPLWLMSDVDRASIVAQNAPHVLSFMMNISLVGLLISGVLSTLLLPQRPVHKPRYRIAVMFAQWVMFPVVMICFGSLPAIDAQTRLMTGRELGFWVTEKGGKRGG